MSLWWWEYLTKSMIHHQHFQLTRIKVLLANCCLLWLDCAKLPNIFFFVFVLAADCDVYTTGEPQAAY